MAEFKLGRIRFVWKGDWIASTPYYKDDIVRNGGNTYICVAGHQSPALFTDNQDTYWDKISDGVEWKDDWETNTYYKVNDIVKYGGYLYIANTAHTSDSGITEGLENDQSKWDLFAEGFDYKSNWDVNSRYKINDIVKYNGTVYLCIQGHTSATTVELGLEADSSKWETFSEGFYWKSEWATSTRYRKNDIVKYGGIAYVCNTGHTSAATVDLGLEDNQSFWDTLNAGIEYKTSWASSVRYKLNDVVKYGGGLWICVQPHTSQTDFTVDEGKWAQFVDGLEFEDSWDNTSQYQPGDFVTYGGYSYISLTNNTNSVPNQSATDWSLFATGFRFVGDWVAPQDYLVGDVVRKNGYTYLATANSTGQEPPNSQYWEQLNSGFKWRNDVGAGDGSWTDGIEYKLGDTIRYGINAYVCVTEHTSDETVTQNRPDQDLAGTFWNVVSGGPESSNLTSEGDLVYYGGNGPTRLPIGQPGQVLSVNNDATAPTWKNFGAINHVYYVENKNGKDIPAPDYGTTLDRPWASVGYAASQVEKGPLRPDSTFLLEMNRSFMQDEVMGWIDARIAEGTGIWSGFTVSDETKYKRNVGQIADAVIYDLRHDGNVETVKAALSYFNEGTLITEISDENQQLAASIDYMKELVDAIMSNLVVGTDVGTKYRTLNQYVDTNLTEETDSQEIAESLLTVVSTALDTASTESVPNEYKPNNTIFVKTGEFLEVLPIIVPENCAVVGDELRSTRIKPALSLVDSSDTPYSLDALTRLKAIISDVVTAPGTITKTSGNAEDPVTTQPVGSATAGTALSELVQQIYDYVDWGVNGATADSTVPQTTGTLTPKTDTGHTYAVESLEANREFIKAEIVAYIANAYPAYNYSVDSYKRDVDRYIDALKYDLIYTGNYKSLLAARYYVNSVNGSVLEDMFYFRNGTGLRNCTLRGLTGQLGSANAYGTKRPTAGAFVSLDPGFGPADSKVWITTKSPYIQNVSTFGHACVGMKVDGDLHAGGNDSIVANDFTQICSDGISIWCTNLARTELVSVFSYYAHIGYLAEAGGKIRATNGNSSYGNFGTVAEGVDSTEVPINGLVDNRSQDAKVGRVFTNSNEILVLEYLNAGQEYTAANTTITVTGEGYNADIDQATVVNGGVFQVRLRDTNGNFGGSDYVYVQNVAQSGDSTSIKISNTDTAIESAEYEGTTANDGVAIFITSGKGAGQYGYVDSFDPGTKDIVVRKYSDDTLGWDHVVPGTAIETTLDESTNYSIEPRLKFDAPASGLYSETAKARAVVEDGKIIQILLFDPGAGYATVPNMTIFDPNNTVEAPFTVRIGDGVLSQPTWLNRGVNFDSASATVSGDGYADDYQPGNNIQVKELSDIPKPGANITFNDIADKFYKIVTVRGLSGAGPYSALIQLSPEIGIEEAPEHETSTEIRFRYSQVRLTGHDYLDIGTGNFEETNYPDDPLYEPDAGKEVVESGGGRVFYTSTDQDGNFRVGRLFNVEQATGKATLNADAFNISGLQELQLGSVELGGTGSVITEFSTDGTFTANSDNVIPTQKAIKTYITSQIGGGSGELNVNNITAGTVYISGNTISTTTGGQINITKTVNYTGGIAGDPVALNYFLHS